MDKKVNGKINNNKNCYNKLVRCLQKIKIMDQLQLRVSCSKCTLKLDHLKRQLDTKVKYIQAEFNEKLIELSKTIDFVNTHLASFLDSVFEDFLNNDVVEVEQVQMDRSTNSTNTATTASVICNDEDVAASHYPLSTIKLDLDGNIDDDFYEYENDPRENEKMTTETYHEEKLVEAVSAVHEDHQCSTCLQSFSHKQSLRSHQLRAHAPYVCKFCDATVFGLTAFQAHHRMHPCSAHSIPVPARILSTVEQPKYVCDICAKTLTTKNGLVAHLRTHSREKWHECEICCKSFAQKNTLIVHMRTHTNERPLMCHHCSRTFNQPSTFKRHMLKHDGVKPFKCTLCDRAFVEKTKLDVHMLTHTGERPHICPICQRGYTKKYHLKKHVRNFHNIADADSVLGPVKERRSNIRSALAGV